VADCRIEDGGSPKMPATILLDKNVKMNTVIFHEFIGVGNLELTLGQESADQQRSP
jgi:transcription termination factor Rho